VLRDWRDLRASLHTRGARPAHRDHVPGRPGLCVLVLVFRTFRSYSEVGRKARVVQYLADVQIELETTRTEWVPLDRRQRGEDARARTPRAEEGTTTREGGRGRSQVSDGEVEKSRPPGNELGLSGMDRKREAAVGNGGDPADNSYSSIGM